MSNKIILSVLQRVIVRKFYESHAGLFFFIFFLMFGTVESSQLLNYHLSLMNGMIHAPIFLLVVSGFWLLYWLKALIYILQRFDLPENEFLFRIGLLTRKKQLLVLAALVATVGLPVLLYSGAVMGLSFSQHKILPGLEIVLFHLLIILLASLVITRKINGRHRAILHLRMPSILKWQRPRPFVLFYVHHLTSNLNVMLLVTKMLSVVAIIGFFQITPDGYDTRIGLLGFLFGLAAHSVIVFEFRRFEDQYLLFTRNLPLTLTTRFLTLAAVYGLLLLPEAVVMVTNHLQIYDVALILVYGIGFLTFLHAAQFNPALTAGPDMEKHLTRILGLFLISFLIILMRIYWIEAIVLWSLAGYFYHSNFYRFESMRS